ncbi:MAG: hypothetical protein IPN34_08440 [Planctomycetes bacterium]|nr:hypothetical protein [Planctomycetota bacterium]
MNGTSDERATPDWLRAALDALERGDWESAHELVQHEEDPRAAWVHAHLHRVEGDEANAAYWYRRARRALCRLPLEQERVALRAALLR